MSKRSRFSGDKNSCEESGVRIPRAIRHLNEKLPKVVIECRRDIERLKKKFLKGKISRQKFKMQIQRIIAKNQKRSKNMILNAARKFIQSYYQNSAKQLYNLQPSSSQTK